MQEASLNKLTLIKCNTCNGYYCDKCNEKHKLRKDKYKVIHNDKCKKPLNNKLLQGDTIEHPLYIQENKLKIDFKYYLEHQIEKPVYQIFELVMKNPEKIIEDLLRKLNNMKNGNHSIKDWLKLGNKKETIQETIFNIKDKVINNIIIDEEENLLGDQFEEDIIDDLDEFIIEDNDI